MTQTGSGAGAGGEPPVLDFADVESLQDLATFVSRARAVDANGAIRLQVSGDALAAWVCVLPGRGLLGQGVVLGLRVMPLAPGSAQAMDVAVPLAAITDRLARRGSAGEVGSSLPVPPGTATPSWTALTPPRTGWQPVGSVPAESLLAAATDGIAEVAQGTPAGAGGHAVDALRNRVWSAPLPGHPESGVPTGAGFAAYTLGFARPGEQAQVHGTGGWTRVSLPAGHVLTR